MRTAVFVDAGYLYAQGSAALVGSAQRRGALELDISGVMSKLRQTVEAQADDAPLLRVYWYDGVLPSGPSYEQQRIADTDNVKLRLGIINPYGQQKGVDSLIVTDLVELARNHAITDAVLLSGDEDVRIGVQIAQSFGVRVHLIGIEPSRGSQSRSLLQESDTTTEWSKSDLEEFLSVSSDAVFEASTDEESLGQEFSSDRYTELAMDQVIDELLASIDNIPASEVDEFNRGDIPYAYDRILLIHSRGEVGRDLNSQEKRRLRVKFRERLSEAGYI